VNNLRYAVCIAAFLTSVFLTAPLFALSQQTLTNDITYYRRVCKEQHLDANGRSYILTRIQNKYAGSSINLEPLRAEFRKLKEASAAPANKPKAHVANGRGTVDRLLVSEAPQESRITVIARGITRHNYFLLRDPEPGRAGKIVLDLYGADNRLAAKARDVVLRNGLFSRVRTAQFDESTVRVVADLRADAPYRVEKGNGRWIIVADKQQPAPTAGAPAADDSGFMTASLAPAAGVTAGTPPPPVPVPAPVPAPEEQTDEESIDEPAPLPAPRKPTAAKQTSSPAQAPLERGTTATYRIETGDVLGVSIFPADELSRESVVQLDGTIPFPLIGTIKAKGLTPHQLEDEMRRALSRYLSNPQVAVTVKQFSRRQIFVTGEVRSVGTFSYKENMRLMEFISSAGGFTENANRKEVKVFRGTADKKKVFTIDVEEIIRSGDFSRDFQLEPGDIVEVAQGKLRVAILGDVHQPGYLDYKEGLHLLELISQAGGFLETAQLNKVNILHEGKGGTENVTLVNLKDILSGKKADVPIRHGDTVYVPRKGIASANWFATNILPWLSLISLVLVIGSGV
jgi:polysaccharide export outer membrane protein